MSKIYLVTVGAYSDFGIDSAWSTEAQAQKMAQIVDGEVQEYELDTPSRVNMRRGYVCYLDFSTNTIQATYETPIADDSITHMYEYTQCSYKKVDNVWRCFSDYTDSELKLVVIGYGETKELAEKRAFDCRAIKIAELEQIT